MRNEKVTIRKAKIKDVPLIVRLFVEFMNDHKKIVLQNNLALKPHVKRKKNADMIFKNFIEKNIKSNKSLVNIAEIGGKIVGYSLCFIKDIPPVYNLDRIGYVSDLYIKKKFRGSGISTRFKDEAFRFFRRKGIRYSSIMVQKENVHAHSIYKKWGFFDYRIEMRKKL